MAGIASYGVYVPVWRLSREAIGKEWAMPAAPGEKAVGNFDEDSLTMATAATLNCLKGMDRQAVDGLYLCTTTSPYKEKQVAAVAAAAADLPKSMITVDFSDSLRAGTQGLRAACDSIKAGSNKQVLVAAADTRIGAPRSQFEMFFGDGAAALLIADANVAAEIQGMHSAYHEITDVWRAEGTDYVNSWEDRFVIEEGYLKSVTATVAEAFKKFGTSAKDYAKAVIYAPDFRRHAQIAKTLGFNPQTQLQDGYYANLGIAGCAHPFLMLAGALDEAKPGDKILLVSYGDGTDVVSLRTTDLIGDLKAKGSLKKQLETKKMVPDYPTYAQWKGIVSAEAGARRPAVEPPSSSAQWRERDQILRLYGVKCNHCGTVQYPPQRVCTRCQTKDDFTKTRLSDKGATLFTYALDYIGGTVDTPHVISVINFNGGGRMVCSMTDREIEGVKIGMPLDMTFRKLFSIGGVHNYYWKCMPARD